MRRSRNAGIALAVLFLVLLSSCDDVTQPQQPKTIKEATQAFDAAVEALGWAQVDLWKLGGRDILVSVQLDTALAPHYFRLPRVPKVAP